MQVINRKHAVCGVYHECPKCGCEVFNDSKTEICQCCGQKIEFPTKKEIIKMLMED